MRSRGESGVREVTSRMRRECKVLFFLILTQPTPPPSKASVSLVTLPVSATRVKLGPRFQSTLQYIMTKHYGSSLIPLPSPLISAFLPITGRNEEDPAVPVTTGQAVRAAAAAAAREVEVEVEIPKPVRSDSILFYCSLLACPSVTLHLILTYSALQGRGDNDVPDFINKLRRRK
jgi:hypothetical protein